eukprot:675325-Rhodomonas_salina.2
MHQARSIRSCAFTQQHALLQARALSTLCFGLSRSPYMAECTSTQPSMEVTGSPLAALFALHPVLSLHQGISIDGLQPSLLLSFPSAHNCANSQPSVPSHLAHWVEEGSMPFCFLPYSLHQIEQVWTAVGYPSNATPISPPLSRRKIDLSCHCRVRTQGLACSPSFLCRRNQTCPKPLLPPIRGWSPKPFRAAETTAHTNRSEHPLAL